MSVKEVMQLIDRQVRYLRTLTEQHPETDGCSSIHQRRSAHGARGVLEACHTAMAAWGVGRGGDHTESSTTVENATPNGVADQIE